MEQGNELKEFMTGIPAPVGNGSREIPPSTSSLLSHLALKFMHRRRQLDLKQPELAARAGVSTPLISLLERGKANISLDKLHQIAEALKLKIVIGVEDVE